MAGISTKAAGGVENKKTRYNGYELTTDLNLNLYESFYRTHDPQIARFLQIDPKPDEQIGLYTAMGNNPISLGDFLGDTTQYYSENGVLLYTTRVSGYNHVTIVNDQFAKNLEKLPPVDLSEDQQKDFDKAVNMLEKGTTYDITAMKAFFDEEANKTTAETIKGERISDMKNLKLDGKKIDPKSIKAEATADLVRRNGIITVGNLRRPENKDFGSTHPPDGVAPSDQYTGAHIHTHSRISGTFTFDKNQNRNFYEGPSPGDRTKSIADSQFNKVWNVVVDPKTVYITNGSQTIPIPR